MKADMIKSRNHFLIASLATLIFSAVYERFSHQVYSNYMIYAFLIPLAGGALVYGLFARLRRSLRPAETCRRLYASALATFTTGSLFEGALEIYGTTSRLSRVYWIGGGALALLTVAAYIGQLTAGRRGMARRS